MSQFTIHFVFTGKTLTVLNPTTSWLMVNLNLTIEKGFVTHKGIV
jgi:hypothetical protein